MKIFIMNLVLELLCIGCLDHSKQQNNSNVKEQQSCYFPYIQYFNTDSLESQLVGQWTYQYSRKKDSCFSIERFILMPNVIDFNPCSERTKEAMPSVFQLDHDNGFKNLCAGISASKKSRESVETYLFYYTGFSGENVEDLEVIHYYGDKKSIGKEYIYNINSLMRDTLIVSYDTPESFGEGLKKDMYHFYLRAN